MSNNIPRVSLKDSLYVLQLARETALAQNRKAQAERMMPVVDEIRGLVTKTYQAQTPPSTGVMGQADFKALLGLAQSRSSQPTVAEFNRLAHGASPADRSDGRSQYA